MRKTLLISLLIVFALSRLSAQSGTLNGTIVNSTGEPLALVSVSVKDMPGGKLSSASGTFSITLSAGRYELIFSMIGHKTRVVPVVIRQGIQEINIILETDHDQQMQEVVVQRKLRDRSVEYVRNVIRHKDSILALATNYSATVYIKAVQVDSVTPKKSGKPKDSIENPNRWIDRMNMAEVIINLDKGHTRQLKETRTAIAKRGFTGSLFYLSTTEGDFNLYNNLLHAPALSPVPLLSPVSYSGLLAYRYRLIQTKDTAGRKVFTIEVKPRQVSNATIDGVIEIMDSLWVIVNATFRVPKYHLPVYDFFEVSQRYELIDQQSWMITRQVFRYGSDKAKTERLGETDVHYREFQLNRHFSAKHFGNEWSATSAEAYKRDSAYWSAFRPLPLNEKELRYINYKDSVQRVKTSEEYLDSVDRAVNAFTLKKLLWTGQTLQDHKRQRRWSLPPLPALYQPFQFGGSRISLSASHSKVYPSRKNLNVFAQLSYGIRNKDINGSVRLSKMYNPFNRGFYTITAGRDFRYIYSGDAWINMLKRSNIYLDNSLGIGHGLELLNGLYLYTDLDFAFRRSVSDYRTNDKVDSAFGDLLTNNQAQRFQPYNATYGKIRLAYTPGQRYMREPAEKIILGSSWPTIYALWRKGLPGFLGSTIDFDYLEFGLEQEVKAGLAGLLKYTVKSGSFLQTRDLRLVDYQFQRRGDPILFMNPHEAFQALDSTFAVFRRYYQANFVHEFNGAIINKIPLLKKLGLREVAGTGFLLAPERNLRYAEAFAGIERVFKWPFNVDNKFKLGVYVVGSGANQFKNPVQFKIGITAWDRRRNKWH